MIEHAPDQPAKLLRAVLDTSVLLSGHRHWLWLLMRHGYYEGIWSTFIVGEMVRIRVTLAIKHGQARVLYRERINALVHRFSAVLGAAAYVPILDSGALEGVLPDADDTPVLATAVAAHAGFIVSLN